MILFLISCEKDPDKFLSNSSQDKGTSITKRTVTTPGSFSVNADSILSFPTVQDFHQTAEYIASDTSNTQRNSFRSSFAIKTLNKQADIIFDSIDNFLYYPSKISTYWSNYDEYVDLVIQSGDTAVTAKYGIWGEFLNLQNLVIIEGSLYKITKDKTIMILDGDLGKLDDAEELEESDTTQGIYINLRACLPCDPTGWEWKYDQVEYQYYSGHNYRITSTEIFSNLTIWKPAGGNKVRVTPKFVHSTEIHIQKKGIVWFCHRMHFNWNAQVWVTHNLKLPASAAACPNCATPNLWYESKGWNNQYECKFEDEGVYEYDTYVTPATWDMPGSYCMAVKIFSQNAATTDNPVMTNGWYFYPYPVFDCSSYYDNNCPNFNWLYPL